MPTTPAKVTVTPAPERCEGVRHLPVIPRGWDHIEDSLACGSVSITADAIRLNAMWFLPNVSPELGDLVALLMELPEWRRRTFTIFLKDEATRAHDPNTTRWGRAALILVADAIAEPALASALLVLRRAEDNASRGLPWAVG